MTHPIINPTYLEDNRHYWTGKAIPKKNKIDWEWVTILTCCLALMFSLGFLLGGIL